MGFSEHRAQLLANIGFLYGANTEVFTLSYNGGHQAIAMRYDTFSATHTKFLHGNGNSVSTWDAIQSLLQATEIEIAKRFSMNGVGVPFSGQAKVEGVMLNRRVPDIPAPSSISSSEQFIATPQSSLSGRDIPHPCECYDGEPQTESPPVVTDAVDDFWGSSSSEKKKKGKKVATGPDWWPVEPKPNKAVPQDSLPVVEYVTIPATLTVDEWDSFWGVKKSKKDKSSLANASECPALIEQTVASQTDIVAETTASDPVADFDWESTWGRKKDKKKSKKARTSVEDDIYAHPIGVPQHQPQSVEEPTKVEDAPVTAPEPEKVSEDDPWAIWAASSTKKSKRDKKKKVRIETPLPEPEEVVEASPPTWEFSVTAPPEPEEVVEASPSTWEFSVPAPPEPEPEPVPEPEEIDWGSFGGTKSKKDKKKKRSFGFEVEDPVPESMTPEPVPEESHWDFSSTKTNNSEDSVVEAPAPVSEEKVEDDFGWGAFTSSKKDKKKKKSVGVVVTLFDEEAAPPSADIEPPISESEPVIEDHGWGSFGVSKKDKKKKKSSGSVFDFIVSEEVPPPAPADSESPIHEPEPVSDEWSFGTKRNLKEKSLVVEEEILPASPASYVVDEFGWGSWVPTKKGKKKCVVIEEEIPLAEPEPAVDADDFGWGSFATKKSKKKNSVVIEEEVAPAEPKPEPEVVDEVGCGTKKDKGKEKTQAVVEGVIPLFPVEEVEQLRSTEVIEEPKDEFTPPPAPAVSEQVAVAAPERENWMNWGTPAAKEDPQPAEEPAAPEDDGWGSFSTKKKSKKGKGKKTKSLTQEPVVECFIQDCPCDAIHNVVVEPPPLPQEPVLETTVNTEVSTMNDPPPLPPSTTTPTPSLPSSGGKTIVLKIVYFRSPPSQDDKNFTILGTMATLKENSLEGIFAVVNTYLDGKFLSTSGGERKMEVKEAVGRGGSVFDVSGVVEGMWGEYLEYFEGLTRFVELVVEVVEL